MRWPTVVLSAVLGLTVPVARAYSAADYHVPSAVTNAADTYAVLVHPAVAARELLTVEMPGSGCRISPNLVLTNWHVVLRQLSKGTDRVRVDLRPAGPGVSLFANGRVIYVAPQFDLALVKLDRGRADAGARISESARVGDRIYPAGFTKRPENNGRRARVIDTGEIGWTGVPPRADARWLQYVAESVFTREAAKSALETLGPNRLRPRLAGEPRENKCFPWLSNAKDTGGQSGGPCFGENGEVIALNHSGQPNAADFNESGHVPTPFIRLFLVGVGAGGELYLPIRSSFNALGGSSKVGAPFEPTGHHFARRSGSGVLQVFRYREGERERPEDSAIMLQDNTKRAYWVKGAIWAHYASKGGPQYIGYPVADEEEAEGGRQQRFEKGPLYWSRATGQVSKRKASGEPVRLRSKNGDMTALVAGGVTDFTLTFEVNVAKREGSAFFRLSSDSGEVYGRPTQGLSGYGVIFCPFSDQGANPGLYLVKRVNGAEQTLASTQTGFPRAHGRSRLTISARGGELAVYEGGSRVLRAEDTSYGRGDVVFRVYGDPELPADAQFRATEFQRLR